MPNWIKIKIEYETTNISYRKLAAKHDVVFSTLEKRARREGWTKSKKDTCDTIEAKVRQKAVAKVVDRNSRFLTISDMATEAIEEYLKGKHYKQHVVKYKYYDSEGKADHEELTSVLLDVADTKALANIVSSLDKIQKGQRLAEGLDKQNDGDKGKLDELIAALAAGGVKRD